jgi:hypothetical protein
MSNMAKSNIFMLVKNLVKDPFSTGLVGYDCVIDRYWHFEQSTRNSIVDIGFGNSVYHVRNPYEVPYDASHPAKIKAVN